MDTKTYPSPKPNAGVAYLFVERALVVWSRIDKRLPLDTWVSRLSRELISIIMTMLREVEPEPDSGQTLPYTR